MDRRSFLKRAGGFSLAAGVPLFIPMDRLEFGLPSTRLIVASQPDIQVVRGEMVSDRYREIYSRISPFLYESQMAIQEWNGEGWVDVKGKVITRDSYRAVNLLKNHPSVPNTLVRHHGDRGSFFSADDIYFNAKWEHVNPRTVRTDKELAFAHSLPPKMRGPSDPSNRYNRIVRENGGIHPEYGSMIL